MLARIRTPQRAISGHRKARSTAADPRYMKRAAKQGRNEGWKTCDRVFGPPKEGPIHVILCHRRKNKKRAKDAHCSGLSVYHFPRPTHGLFIPCRSLCRCVFSQLHGNPVSTIIPLRTKLPHLLSYEDSPGRILGITDPLPAIGACHPTQRNQVKHDMRNY